MNFRNEFVQNISAMSFLTLRLSVNLVSPPVPGKTPNNGTSGRLTVLERSSTNRISSHASATSYPPPAQIPLTAAINFKDPDLLESSNPFLVSFVNLQKLTFQECSDIPNIYMFAPAEKFFPALRFLQQP